MKKSWHLTAKILSGEKTVETRWYKNRAKPWNCIKAGETIYFKDSGEPVTIKATVSKVEQYGDLDQPTIQKLLSQYWTMDAGKTPQEIRKEIEEYAEGKRYAMIIHLKNPQKIEPFDIDKKGYGAMAAWLCLEDINMIKKE